MKVGLDFGTTNSVVSYWDEKSEKPAIFNFDNAGFVPTAALWEHKLNEIYGIGNEAKNKWQINPDRYTLHQTFKPLLGDSTEKEWLKRGWNGDNSPQTVTKLFIEWLLSTSSDSFTKNIGSITNLVVSVPEFWHGEGANHGAEALRDILLDLGLPLDQLVSEPVAAVAYYLWKSKMSNKESQNILVFDSGGGTFDASFCKVGGGKIEVIGSEGNDNDLAGMFHLKQIVRNALKRIDNTLEESSLEFRQLVWGVESLICGDREQKKLAMIFDRFRKDPRRYDIVFETVRGVDVYMSDVFNAYGEIHDAIQEVVGRLNAKTDAQFHFDQILLVGGFSQYFLVRKTILDYFQLKETDSKVRVVSKHDSYLAIASGAALISAGKIEVIGRYPHSVFYDAKLDGRDYPVRVAKTGQKIRKSKAFYSDTEVIIENDSFGLSGYLYLDGDKDRKVSFKCDVDISDLELLESRKCRVGLLIDKSNLAYFVIQNNEGVYNKYPLGDILRNR